MKYIPSYNLSKSNLSGLPEIIPREVLFRESIKYPKISPDGQKLAYISPVNNVMNLFIKTIGKEDDRVITDLKKRGIHYYIWATNKYIVYLDNDRGYENFSLYKLNVENMEITILTPDKNAKVGIIHCNRELFPDELIFSLYKDKMAVADLYRVNLNSNESTLIEQNPGNVAAWLIDNNFRASGIISVKDNGETELSVRIFGENGLQEKTVWTMKDKFLSQPLCFSGDNKYIYISDGQTYETGRIIKIEIKTGKAEVIAFNETYDLCINVFNHNVSPYENATVLINPNGAEIDAAAFYEYRKKWIVINKTLEEDFKAIKELDSGDFSVISQDDEGKTWIIAFEHDNGPVSYYSFNRELKKGTFIFYNKPELNNYTLAPVEEVTFSSRDNMTIHGYITCPAGIKREKLPLVLLVHQGPWQRDIWEYNPVVQWLAGRGYACLQINYRGSTGYGREFLNAGNKEWGGKMQDDLIDGVNWAIEKGIADPARIAIYGKGYGGYAALAGAVFTPHLFCCAIAIQCPGNLVTFLQSLPKFWKHQNRMIVERVGDIDKDRDMLISRSPVYRLEQIKSPLLIAYGLNSPRVTSSEPYRLVQTMKSKGISVEHIVFPDEGHEIMKEENRFKFYTITEKFLSRHMGGRYEAREINLRDIYLSPSSDNNFYRESMIDKILKEGDTEAFENLMEPYKKPLLKYFFYITGNRDTGEELLQDVLFRVWLYLNSYSFLDNTPFSSWLFKVAANVVNDYRTKNSKLNNEISLEEINLDISATGYKETIEDKMFVHSLINSLKEPYKTSLFLRFVKDLNYKDIASLMNTDENNIKAYLHRAKKYLLKSLDNL
ncbi:MAG: sigma-70 family RNA polymerase sigma factor [Candidatus Eremiobacterota bacterium]